MPGSAGLASGTTYYWRAKATDSNSSQSAAYSSIRSFTVDTGAPTNAYSLTDVSSVGGLPGRLLPGSGTTIYYNGSAGSGAKSFTIEAAVTDPISGGASVTTQNFNGGLSNLTHTDGTTTTPGSGVFDTNPFAYTAPTSHDGSVDVFRSDAAGNPSTTASFTLHNDSVAPTATVGFPTASVYNSAGWTGTLTGTASDADAGVGTVKIAIHDNTANTDYDGSSFGAGGQQYLTATGTTSWSYALAAAKLTDGHNYTITVETIDNVGNTDTSATSKTFTYDTTAPTVSSVSASNAERRVQRPARPSTSRSASASPSTSPATRSSRSTRPRPESATYASGSRHLDARLRLHRPGRRQRRDPRLRRDELADAQRRHDRRPGRQHRHPDPRHPGRGRLARRQQEHRDRHHRPDRQLGHRPRTRTAPTRPARRSTSRSTSASPSTSPAPRSSR